ncbi:MAG: (Fe-S)-binding protein [Thermodesulfovibrionales bacterium]|nr:(Fe-S)-binding protein [Thermodesulfovibrionales bacterium]
MAEVEKKEEREVPYYETVLGASPEKLATVDYKPPAKPWMDVPPKFKKLDYLNPAKVKWMKVIDLPFPREWSPPDEDWKLPENWKEIFLNGMEDRLKRFRSFQLFMDICVRCGACADKCQFFIGGGDPKNMPVLRAELLRSIYRRYFTTSGKILGKIAGARELTVDVIKELFKYSFQCTECRRCSVFCPYGIDMAEITMIARELLLLLGMHVNWAIEPVGKSFLTGNHMGLLPHTIKDFMDEYRDELEKITGFKVDVPMNRKGAEILYIVPSGDFFDERGVILTIATLLYFYHIGLDYTWSTYTSEGGNFGLFTSHEMIKRLNAKMYAEAKRLKVKWILGGECGHMWRVINQYMGTVNGPADFLEEPVSPITGTKFENAKDTKMVHIAEFTADLIRHGKLKLDPSRNDHVIATYHDSCNPSRAMGLFEEPRYIIKNVCNNFYEMPESCIREKTFCCGGGAGLGTDEQLETLLRGNFPRSNATKHVHEKFGVNRLLCMCAIDRAVLSMGLSYWCPQVTVGGVHELLANALVIPGESPRTVDLRRQPLKRPITPGKIAGKEA